MNVPVIVIFAPTASGKTALSESLFGHSSHSFFKDKAEIINADSMQIYKYMNVGTAKPDKKTLQEIPHHLVDLLLPSEQYTVADFVEKADICCHKIYNKGKIPVIAGGTGFYIKHFILGLPATPAGNETVRNKLHEKLEKYGSEMMYAELIDKDPVSAASINKNDNYRIIRALEIFYVTGKPRSSFNLSLTPRKDYNFCTIVLQRPRKELYQRINDRVDQMFSEGLADEYVKLMKQGFSHNDPGLQAIGYREFSAENYENLKESERNTVIEKIKTKIKTDSRRFAKKQYTYITGIPDAFLIPVSGDENGLNEVNQKIQDFMIYYS